MRKIVFTVTNDLNYDQRMKRICSELAEAGYEVSLIGRLRSHSKELPTLSFSQVRLRCIFDKGKLFYIEYNLRLFFHLLFRQFDILCAIDLDTILPSYIIASIKRKIVVYDAHEYFTELPEIIHRPFVRTIWTMIEKMIVPRVKHGYTINQSYADLFKEHYNKEFGIIKNATVLEDITIPERKERIILYQGAVNVGRGVEELITAMAQIDAKLHIYGIGNVYNDCISLTEKLDLSEKVHFFGSIAPEQLKLVTRKATIGTTFFTNDGLSYYYSLANRFFDHIHACLPQLGMNYPEYKRINDEFEVAILLDNLSPDGIAKGVNKLLDDKDLYDHMVQNCLKAREVLNWQNEAKKLVAFYNAL